MADNTILNLGSGGDTVATDDIAGVKYPRGKITLGSDGVNDGDVSTANPMPVSDAGGTLTVDAPVGTPVFVRLSDGAAAITTLPVSLASVPSHDVTNAGTFAVQVSNSVTVNGTVTADTELPAAGALADNTANPTTPIVGSCLMGFDGTTWDRIYTLADGDAVNAAAKGFLILGHDGANYQVPLVDSSGRLYVNINGTVTTTISGAVDTELPAAAALADATANPTAPAVGGFAHFYNGTTWDRMRGTTTGGTWANIKQLNDTAVDTNSGNKSAGTLRVVLATDQPQLTNKLLVTPDAGSTVQDIPNTSGGLSIYRNFQTSGAVIAAAIKASAGQVYGIEVTNINATPVYVRLYNQTGSPGTTDTVVWSAIVPGNTAGAGIVRTWDKGMAFGTGIGIRITNAVADNDNTALTANTVMCNVQYK